MNYHEYDVIIIGSGCAGLNTADCLYENGVKNIAVVTEGFKMGTSRNTGSDKQTYYKQAIASDTVDGAGEMAKTLFSGGAVNGDTALTESANSLKCFFKLVSLGVPFPKNEYGEYVGYQTDHDENKRATSAGPLTSKYMTEALEKEVIRKNIKIFDNTTVFKLIKHSNKISGAIGYNSKTREYELFSARFVVLATGGSAYLYRDKVFPYSQSGMSGMAIESGAQTSNITEWQYGLASVDFRWNVSGTYQQVLPRYVSVDENGSEHEFLLDYFDTPLDAINTVFMKGYQWPFDSKKLDGSSKIDVCVHKEMQKGRAVYMDFRRNPTGLDFDSLSNEAKVYLKKSGALFGAPIERLNKMNKKAIDLYKAHKIDLYKDMLRVAVCAQHQNGGISVDKNYETSVHGLYAVGEAAGVFGVYRPGGTALNSTQVSSLCAAEAISKIKIRKTDNREFLIKEAQDFIGKIKIQKTKSKSILKIQNEIQAEMSVFAGFLRDEEKIAALQKKVKRYNKDFFTNIGAVSENQLYALFKLRDMLITAETFLNALSVWCKDAVYRGGAVSNGKKTTDKYDNLILITKNKKVFWENPRKIPKSETWFETVYNQRR